MSLFDSGSFDQDMLYQLYTEHCVQVDNVYMGVMRDCVPNYPSNSPHYNNMGSCLLEVLSTGPTDFEYQMTVVHADGMLETLDFHGKRSFRAKIEDLKKIVARGDLVYCFKAGNFKHRMSDP